MAVVHDFSSLAAASDSTKTAVQAWFVASFKDGETQLVAGASTEQAASRKAFSVCSELPALMSRSTRVAPNGGCPDVFTAVNGSCTCLTGVSNQSDAWTFRVREKTARNKTIPLTQAVTDVLAIDVIRTLWAPASLRSLKVVGVGSSPVSVVFAPDDRGRGGTASPIVQSANSTANVTSIEIANIDMHTTALSDSALFPSSAASISLRRCNISSFGYEFALGMDDVKIADLSENNLTKPYAGSAIVDQCTHSMCSLEEFNVSFNHITTFPTTALSIKTLRRLYIQGNQIDDFNISADVFERISALEEFVSDVPVTQLTCADGYGWRTAHGASFCVAGAFTIEAPPNVLQYVVIAGALVVAVLIFIIARQRHRYRIENRQSPSSLRRNAMNSMFGSSVQDSELSALHRLLQHDPVIAARRVVYSDLKFVRCLSRGGFGVVFAGEFHGVPVAIKKIQSTRGLELQQFEQFVREIALLARLRHPRVIELVGVAWESLLDLSAVTELMARGDLREVLLGTKVRGCALPWGTVKTKIALHIAEGLAYLHSLSPAVVHRDLKSKNVLLNDAMDAKLSDFGVAREWQPHPNAFMTACVGTSFWIAPEVLSGDDYDERADIYSLGVVLSELDTGDFPYWNAQHPPGSKLEERAILELVALGRKRPTFTPQCPPAVLALAERCLLANPVDRPSAVEVAFTLQRLGTRMPGSNQSVVSDFSESEHETPDAINIREEGIYR